MPAPFAPTTEREPTIVPAEIEIKHYAPAWAYGARRANKGGMAGAPTACLPVARAYIGKRG